VSQKTVNEEKTRAEPKTKRLGAGGGPTQENRKKRLVTKKTTDPPGRKSRKKKTETDPVHELGDMVEVGK